MSKSQSFIVVSCFLIFRQANSPAGGTTNEAAPETNNGSDQAEGESKQSFHADTSKAIDETAEEQDALKIPTKSSKLDDALEEDRKTHDRALQEQQNAREQMMAEKQERDEAQRKNIDEDAKGVEM